MGYSHCATDHDRLLILWTVTFRVLTATLNLDDILAGKFDLDVVGHYSRPDIFKLSVKE